MFAEASAVLVRETAPVRGLYPHPLAGDAGGDPDRWRVGGQQAATDRGSAAADQDDEGELK